MYIYIYTRREPRLWARSAMQRLSSVFAGPSLSTPWYRLCLLIESVLRMQSWYRLCLLIESVLRMQSGQARRVVYSATANGFLAVAQMRACTYDGSKRTRAHAWVYTCICDRSLTITTTLQPWSEQAAHGKKWSTVSAPLRSSSDHVRPSSNATQRGSAHESVCLQKMRTLKLCTCEQVLWFDNKIWLLKRGQDWSLE